MRGELREHRCTWGVAWRGPAGALIEAGIVTQALLDAADAQIVGRGRPRPHLALPNGRSARIARRGRSSWEVREYYSEGERAAAEARARPPRRPPCGPEESYPGEAYLRHGCMLLFRAFNLVDDPAAGFRYPADTVARFNALCTELIALHAHGGQVRFGGAARAQSDAEFQRFMTHVASAAGAVTKGESHD